MEATFSKTLCGVPLTDWSTRSSKISRNRERSVMPNRLSGIALRGIFHAAERFYLKAKLFKNIHVHFKASSSLRLSVRMTGGLIRCDVKRMIF